jgi:hypothetical protein
MNKNLNQADLDALQAQFDKEAIMGLLLKEPMRMELVVWTEPEHRRHSAPITFYASGRWEFDA